MRRYIREVIFPKTSCRYCSNEISLGGIYCAYCGRDRFFGVKKWEYLFGGTSLTGMLIVVACLAILVITSLGAVFASLFPRQVPVPSPISTPLNAITQQSFATVTSLPIVVQSPIPIIFTIAPTDSVVPTSDPEQFIREYFNAIWQVRNYDFLWSLSTPSFQANASPGGYQEFTSWWGSVDRVDVLSVIVTSNDGHYASVDVHLTFHLKDGRVLSNRDYPYNLIYDSNRQTWMFDYR
jgi:hypothetical protein